MGDNYGISVGIKADFSELKSQRQQGAAALPDFALRGAAVVLAFQAAVKDGASAIDSGNSSALCNSGISSLVPVRLCAEEYLE